MGEGGRMNVYCMICGEWFEIGLFTVDSGHCHRMSDEEAGL